MTTLSAKARAFSVDYLLNNDDSSSTNTSDSKTPPKDDNLCAAMGDGPTCCHESVHNVGGNHDTDISIELCQSELWSAFHNLGTEMIITKTGRRMFPALRVRVSGLRKLSKYRLYLDFIPVDRNKYRYVYHSSKWMVSGTGEPLLPDQLYLHPDSPMDGNFITSQVISFERVKLTNHNKPRYGQVSLVSMQKYQPRIHIEEIQDGSSKTGNQYVTSFPQTAFIAVTAYQNQEITRLKIARNPFAKGFREAGKCRSSLEAMMASFGVVIDSNDSQNPKKRRNSNVEICSGADTALSPSKLYCRDNQNSPDSTTYSQLQFGAYPNVNMQAYKTMTPPKAHCHSSAASSLSLSSLTSSPFIPVIFSPTSPTLFAHSLSSPLSPCQALQTPPNIHPAFRQPSAFTHLTYSDPKWALYNPLASIMCLQPANFVSSPYSAITTEHKDVELEEDSFEPEDESEEIEVV